jgi:hypothetical protein
MAPKAVAPASAPRWTVVDDHARGALEFARQVSPAGSRDPFTKRQGTYRPLAAHTQHHV